MRLLRKDPINAMYCYYKKQYCSICICLLSVILFVSFPSYAADTLPSQEMVAAHSTLLLDTAQSLREMTDQTEEMKKLLLEAQVQEAKQYQLMKLRIQWLYETGRTSILERLLTASDFPDFLNRSEQIHRLIEYDRNKLSELSDLRMSIESDAALLLEQCNLLYDSRESLAKQYEELLTLFAEGNNSSSDFSFSENLDFIPELLTRADSQIEEGKNAANQGNNILPPAETWDLLTNDDPSAPQKDSDDTLLSDFTENIDISTNTDGVSENENQEDEIAPPPFAPPSFSISVSENLLLSALVQCEVGTEDYSAMTALASCILNRVNSPLFPDTIRDVIESEPLFSSVSDGRIESLLQGEIDPVCQNAVFDAISGTNPIGQSLYFTPSSSGMSGVSFGNFTFY